MRGTGKKFGNLTSFVLSRVVGDLQNVEGDPVDARLAEGVEPGDVGARVVDLLHDGRHLGVVVVLELDRAEGRVEGQAEDQGESRKHLVEKFGEATTSCLNHTVAMNEELLSGTMEERNRPFVCASLCLPHALSLSLSQPIWVALHSSKVCGCFSFTSRRCYIYAETN